MTEMTRLNQVGKQITKKKKLSDSPIKLLKTQQSSVNKLWSKRTSSPNQIPNDTKSTLKVIKQTIVKKEP